MRRFGYPWRALAAGALFVGLAAVPPAGVLAATDTVSTCDESHLRSVISGAAAGDTVNFACSGTITLTSSPVSTSFTVTVSPSSLQSLINRLCTDPSVATSLDQDAANIAHAPNAGAKAGALQGFTQLVQAQTGKSLTSDQAKILIALAGAL